MALVKKENIIPSILILGVLVLVSMYIVGFFDSYWGRLNSIYDPVLKKFRCIGESGNLTDIDAPCLYITIAAQEAVNKREERCIKQGGEKDHCIDEAVRWLYEQKPKQ